MSSIRNLLSLTLLALALAVQTVAHAADTALSPSPSRTVRYAPRDIVPLNTRLRFTTLIVLPQGEEIVEAACGDKDFWAINAARNLIHVKPSKEGARSNLNLIGTSGAVYSFVLTEVSEQHDAAPDLVVYVERADDGVLVGGAPFTAAARPSFVPIAELDAMRAQVDRLQTQLTDTREHEASAVQDALVRFRSTYARSLRFSYRIKLSEDPFLVRAMYHDGRFTYIHTDAREVPALYERRDTGLSLVAYDFSHGVYIIPKVLDSGYLVIGRRRLPFTHPGTEPVEAR